MKQIVLVASLIFSGCSSAVQGYHGQKLPMEQVAEITGSSGFGPFGGNVGIAAVNGREFAANPSPQSVELKPGLYDFKLELRYENVVAPNIIPNAVPYQCVALLNQCQVAAGQKYIADYFRLPQSSSEDPAAGNVGVRLLDVNSNQIVCTGSGVCPNF